MYSLDDTIVAVASPPGGAARGVVRISGPDLRSCLEGCFRPDPFISLSSLARPTVVPGWLWLSGFASPAPCDLYLWPGKRSYTGQPVAEVHTIGSPPLLESVVRAACSGGARPAEPGEFTLRAFLAGRIDLTQAEAVLGVIDASGGAELDAALKQLAGGLAVPLRRLRNDLLELLAHLEAGLDFADEDLPFISVEDLLGQLDRSADAVEKLVNQLAFRGETAVLARVVLMGRPNAGKSSLFNALACRTGAIVSEQPGTTRDYLTVELDLDGVKCHLIDTAGLDDDRPEGERAAVLDAAQVKSQEQLRTADVQVLCAETEDDLAAWQKTHGVRGQKSEVGGQRSEVGWVSDRRRIVVCTKCDCAELVRPVNKGIIETSAHTGFGICKLKDAIRAAVLQAAGPRTASVTGTAVRCGESLRLAAASLSRARQAVSDSLGEELIAAEVRVALNEIGKVAGEVYSKDLLNRIFSRFCIGK
jgi:tRNA modification GTPase